LLPLNKIITKMKHCILVLLLISCGQTKSTNLTYGAFKEEVISFLPRISSCAGIDSAGSVQAIKIYNTISYYSLKDPIFEEYLQKFNRSCLMEIVRKFKCEVSVGMGFYCPTQNINIGGACRFCEGSYLRVDSLTIPN
jgi:hypothetical protein